MALSGNGNTMVIGAPFDNSEVGAIYIYIRSNEGIWTSQGSKITVNNAITSCLFGFTVSISNDGNTIAASGPYDNSTTGAVWVLTRTPIGVWEFTNKLIPSDGNAGNFGVGLAISGDASTIVIGGPNDNSEIGAFWIFVLNKTTNFYNQVGNKKIGTGGIAAQQGLGVAINYSGNIIAIGGPGDNSNRGTFYIFVNGIQQGPKYPLPSDSVGTPSFGLTLALSNSGDTLIVSGPGDTSNYGACWAYTLGGNYIYNLMSSKIVGSESVGNALQGSALSMSGDGQTFIIGGNYDNSGLGAFWTFKKFNSLWNELGNKIIPIGLIGNANSAFSVSLSKDCINISNWMS